MIGYGLGIPRALGSGRFMQKIENAEWKLVGYHIFYVAADLASWAKMSRPRTDSGTKLQASLLRRSQLSQF